MSSDIQTALTALTEEWRGRARRFMEEAEQTRRPADMVRLTAMASTLDWAASDLLWIVETPRTADLLRSETQSSPEI